jgi:hypothetical protein
MRIGNIIIICLLVITIIPFAIIGIAEGYYTKWIGKEKKNCMRGNP